MHRLAKDLFVRLCMINPEFRYTADEALMHPWITRSFSDQIPLNFVDSMHQEYLKKILEDTMVLMIYLSQLACPSMIQSVEVFIKR